MRNHPKDMVYWWLAVDKRKRLIEELTNKGIKLKNPHNMKIKDLEKLLRAAK